MPYSLDSVQAQKEKEWGGYLYDNIPYDCLDAMPSPILLLKTKVILYNFLNLRFTVLFCKHRRRNALRLQCLCETLIFHSNSENTSFQALFLFDY